MVLMKPGYSCMLTLAMDLVGGKWKMIILWQLRQGIRRFNELKRLLDGITQKMLTQQLRELESDGMISRTVFAEVPPRVEYGLTELGLGIIPILEALCRFGREFESRFGVESAEAPVDASARA